MFKTKLSVKGKFWRTFCRIEAGFSFLQSKLIRNFDGVKEKQDFQNFREDFNKKNSKKSDIVTIRSGTYLPYLNSDIKISDICSKILYLPTPRK